jgi:hypothetical protein
VRSRRVSLFLGAVMALVALSNAPVFRPAPVLAASATVSQETPLLDSPDPAAPEIALLVDGTVVSLDGPPVDGFYPVTAGDRSGWIRGEAMQIEKELAESDAAEEMAVDASLDETDETAPPTEPVPADGMTPGNEPVPVAADAPVADLTGPDESAPAPTIPDGAAPWPDSTAPTGEGAAQPTIDANVSPIPVAEVAAVGPASVVVEAPILAGPGPEYGFIAMAPTGSTVEQTGHVINGYATVQYAEVTGWLALEHLGGPGTRGEETPPTETGPPIEKPPADAPLAEPPPPEFTPTETTPTETSPAESPTAETAPAETAPVAEVPVEVAPVDAP